VYRDLPPNKEWRVNARQPHRHEMLLVECRAFFTSLSVKMQPGSHLLQRDRPFSTYFISCISASDLLDRVIRTFSESKQSPTSFPLVALWWTLPISDRTINCDSAIDDLREGISCRTEPLPLHRFPVIPCSASSIKCSRAQLRYIDHAHS
jgi:hypothetical protein